MMKNCDDNTQGKKLWNIIDKVDDKYIDEAIMYNSAKKKREKSIFIKVMITAAASIMILITSAVFYNSHNGKNTSDEIITDDNGQKGISAVIGKANLTVSVMASEKASIVMEEGKEVKISSIDYSPLMSSVPAMPFTFSYENDTDTDVTIRVTTRQDGLLLKYVVDSEGIWNCVESGQSMECKAGETLYWKKMPEGNYSKKDSYGKINVDVYVGENCVESKNINIYSEDGITLRAVLK